jgi:putative ABC transport system substrate-binding protein
LYPCARRRAGAGTAASRRLTAARPYANSTVHSSRRRAQPFLAPFRATLAAVALVTAFPAGATRMVVLKGSDSPRIETTLAALRERASMPIDVRAVSADARDDSALAALAADRGTVIVAMGPVASDHAMRLPAPGRVVHCLAGADALRAGLPAIPSEVPAGDQAAWLAKLLPGVRTVAFLFDPARNTRRVEALAAAFNAAGYKTLLRPVPAPAALPAALESIAGRAEALVALPDATVFTRESSRGILLFSFRKRIPVVGPNDAWVRMGALYAVDWDYREVGAACARLAAREAGLADAGAGALRPRVSVNTKSAAHFGATWDAALLKTVDVRHE